MSFTVVCNSRFLYSGTSPGNCKYGFDWSLFEDCPYKVHLKFSSQDLQNIGDVLFTVSLPDLGVNLNSYIASTTTTATSSSVVAIIAPMYLVIDGPGNIQYLEGESTFTIPNKPRNSTFTVYIRDSNNIELTSASTNYIMTLFFEKV